MSLNSELDLQFVTLTVLMFCCKPVRRRHVQDNRKKHVEAEMWPDHCSRLFVCLSGVSAVVFLCRVMVPFADCRIQTDSPCWVVLLTRCSLFTCSVCSDSFSGSERTGCSFKSCKLKVRHTFQWQQLLNCCWKKKDFSLVKLILTSANQYSAVDTDWLCVLCDKMI